MALFGRKKDGVLPEVDKYYQAEKRDRTGLAWLLALVSIAVVAGVLVSLFLAGRWAYNRVAQDDSDATVATVDETADAPSFDGGPSGDDAPARPSESDGQGDQEVVAPTTPAPSTTTPPPSQGQTTPSPTTPSQRTDLPRTGAGDVVITFATVSSAAAAGHYVLQRRKTTR